MTATTAFAVLVAQHVNRRFFNVIHLLSHSIPIIAVQVSMLIVNGKRTLFFTTVLDTFEELEEEIESETYNREYWVKKAQWTLDAADTLLNVTKKIFEEPVLNYLKGYVAIRVGGSNYMRLHARPADKSLLVFRMAQSLQDETVRLLDARNITYVRGKKGIRVTVDREMIERNAELFASIAALVKRSREEA